MPMTTYLQTRSRTRPFGAFSFVPLSEFVGQKSKKRPTNFFLGHRRLNKCDVNNQFKSCLACIRVGAYEPDFQIS